MSKSITMAKGYTAHIPVEFQDNHGRSHAPLTGGEVKVSDDEIVTAELNEDHGMTVIMITAREEGQASVEFRVGDDSDSALSSQIIVTVTPEREKGTTPSDGPTRVDFAVDRVHFEGSPKPESEQNRQRRERRERQRERVSGEIDETNQHAAEQDEARRHTDAGKTAGELSLEARGPVTEQHPSGVDLANQLEARGAGDGDASHPSAGRPGFAALQHSDNPDDPRQPHNPGNQYGGGDTTGKMLGQSTDGQPNEATNHTAAQSNDERPRSQSAAEPSHTIENRPSAARVADSPRDDVKSRETVTKKPEDDKKAQSAQQRGGAATSGTPASAPGSRRG